MGKGQGGGTPIEHVVVVMLENRSFDSMLGFLKRLNPNVDGLVGTETNPIDPADPSKGTVTVSDDSPYITSPDPSHGVSSTTTQIFGSAEGPKTDAKMDGFVFDYGEKGGSTDNGAAIMKCFDQQSVPVIYNLASEFGVFDQMHASVPGPTQPNRMYFHSATSHGATTDDKIHLALGYPQRTIYQNVQDAGHTFAIYYSDFPSTLFLRQLREKPYRDSVHPMHKFYEDCTNGTLPTVSFMEPRWFKFVHWLASDQHPPHDVRQGEYFLNDIYNALRASPAWEKTLFIVTYDEHGGFFDHVPTPLNGVPNPDGIDGVAPFFKFDRLGVRVPFVCVSPWIPKGTVIHSPTPKQQPTTTSQFDHTSFCATVKQLLNLPNFLTKRDAWAATFGDLLQMLDAPRTDCPTQLPVPGPADLHEAWLAAQAQEETPENINAGIANNEISTDPLSDLQESIIAIANGLVGSRYDVSQIKTEHEGAVFVRQCLQEWLSNNE